MQEIEILKCFQPFAIHPTPLYGEGLNPPPASSNYNDGEHSSQGSDYYKIEIESF